MFILLAAVAGMVAFFIYQKEILEWWNSESKEGDDEPDLELGENGAVAPVSPDISNNSESNSVTKSEGGNPVSSHADKKRRKRRKRRRRTRRKRRRRKRNVDSLNKSENDEDYPSPHPWGNPGEDGSSNVVSPKQPTPQDLQWNHGLSY